MQGLEVRIKNDVFGQIPRCRDDGCQNILIAEIFDPKMISKVFVITN